VPLASGLLSGSRAAAETSQHASSPAAEKSPSKPPDWALPPGVEYFTRDRMPHLVDTTLSLQGIPFEAICYYFANYHPSPAQEKFFGKGWTEWKLLKAAKPQFPGHLQPKIPLWGYYDEAAVEWAERDIDAASTAGISAFMIDWFWYDGVQLLQEQLEQGFLKARNRDKMKFSIMWANTDWTNQYPPSDSGPPAVIYKQTYSDKEMDAMVEYWIEHYFSQPNYFRVNGRPLVGLFILSFLANAFGGPDKLRPVLDRMRNRSAKAGFDGIHFVVLQEHNGDLVARSGVDSVTHYHTFDEGYGQGYKLQVSRYGGAVERSVERWKKERSWYQVPYFPDCPVGWDTSARFASQTRIYIDRSPDQYELFLETAKYFLAERKTDPPLIFLSTWNEWTEDHYLLPDTQFGYSYLQAVQRQFYRGQI
jgi:hypothetical protein